MYRSLLLSIVAILLLTDCAGRGPHKAVKPTIAGQRIGQEIEDIIKAVDPDVNVGIKIASLNDGKVIYEKNAGRHYVPGSTVKLITLASALYYLGPSFRFDTIIYADGPIDDKGAVKNLYLKGSGDPSFMDYELTALVDELKQMGLKSVQGNIYVDDQIFDDVLWGKGAMWDDRNRGFSAPISGLNINYNRLVIKTTPREVGKPAFVITYPKSSFLSVIDQVVTKSQNGQKQITVSVERGKTREDNFPKDPMQGLHQGDKVFIKGQTPRSSGPSYNLLAISDPGLFAATFLKDQLHQRGVKIHGGVSRLETPAKVSRLVTHQSRSLSEALVDFTKISNNLGSEVLIKAIAANNGTKPATFSAGFKLVNDFLKNEAGIDPSSLITADGSGLSRYNLVTPDQMVKLLSYAANHFHLAPEFIAALPIGGEDGLLRSRMKEEHIRKNVRAKTGSFAGVSCLAGYLRGIDGQQYAFAIMVNGFIGSTSKYALMEDQILATMMGQGENELAKGQ